MGFFRQTFCSQSPPVSSNSVGTNAALRSRNAFLNFLKEYSQHCNVSGAANRRRRPSLVVEAAEHWNRMALREKFFYIEAAHRADYVYRSRDRRMNRVMRSLRKALSPQGSVNLSYLASAVKQMLLWKRRTLSGIWSMI